MKKVGGRSEYIHRLVYQEHNGPIPPDLVVRHKCDVRQCVRPDHLVLGTHEQNVQDRVARDRSAKGVSNGRAKLDEEKVRQIRRSEKAVGELAREYGVDRKLIRRIRDRKLWRHVD